MTSELRKIQLRESQRRRREMLAMGERGQVNIFMTSHCKEIVDRFSSEYNTDKHSFINALITAFAKSPNSLKLEI